MSKSKKSGKKQTKHFGDITLNDFANSTVSKYRAKKSTSNVVRVLKKLEEDEVAWDEKTEEYEGEFVQTENEDGTISYTIKKSDKKKKAVNKVNFKNASGFDYPLDIWYLISEFIRPEDVGRFAGICRSSFEVVCSAKFWFGLYKRYYRSMPNVPERLQPECMSRLYGARTSVIRSLFYMYPPFVERLQSVTTFEKHPDCLRRRQCILMWHQKQLFWNYYFKLREKDTVSLPRGQRETKKPDLIEMLEDVSANPDENCRVLQVTCEHFVAVPLVQGLILSSVALNLSQGLRHHRLHLGFGSGINYNYQKLDGGNTTIIFDPVFNVKVLDWWHPLYPHSPNIELLRDMD